MRSPPAAACCAMPARRPRGSTRSCSWRTCSDRSAPGCWRIRRRRWLMSRGTRRSSSAARPTSRWRTCVGSRNGVRSGSGRMRAPWCRVPRPSSCSRPPSPRSAPGWPGTMRPSPPGRWPPDPARLRPPWRCATGRRWRSAGFGSSPATCPPTRSSWLPRTWRRTASRSSWTSRAPICSRRQASPFRSPTSSSPTCRTFRRRRSTRAAARSSMSRESRSTAGPTAWRCCGG